MKRKSPFGIFGSVALLCLLIAAEAMAVVHALDFDAHAGADPCKICISVSGFEGAAPAATSAPIPRAATAHDVLPESVTRLFARSERPTARGPPQVS